ncbi:TadE family protein [Zobellella taiwanensis]|uniref:TadE family protein n=1 Tax=Zobellella taiwanensis TaxID=347535 RepID=A0A2P7R9R1_9GAMM|nr:TadE family protein [Zobellella taiwanensis]PSJ46940.1 TadE family protein [Zobellella taiwanensis]
MRPLRSFYSRVGRQKGLAAVEATIVLPVILLLLLAIGEFGRMIYQYNTLTKAVRAGARTASISPNPGTFDLSLVQAKTRNMILYGQEVAGTTPVLPGLQGDDITFNTKEINGQTYVDIHVSYDWTPVFGDSFNTFFGDTISLTFPLESSMTMRVLL